MHTLQYLDDIIRLVKANFRQVLSEE